jgi:hypothetical protein
VDSRQEGRKTSARKRETQVSDLLRRVNPAMARSLRLLVSV